MYKRNGEDSFPPRAATLLSNVKVVSPKLYFIVVSGPLSGNEACSVFVSPVFSSGVLIGGSILDEAPTFDVDSSFSLDD